MRALALVCLLVLLPAVASAEDEAIAFKSHDGFELPAKLSKAKELADADVKLIAVILHGSGPVDMDGTLAAVSADKKGIFIYRRLAHEIAAKVPGGAAIRFHKRGFVWRTKLMADRSLLESDAFKASQKSPYADLVGDAVAWVAYARKRFPAAKLVLIGHSQGTQVALQAANKAAPEDVAGLVMIGYQAAGINVLSFEQLTYRVNAMMRPLDTNKDRKLDAEELKADSLLAKQLAPQLGVLDTDKDGAIGFEEVMAGNFGNYLRMMSNPALRRMAAEELGMPAPATLLQKSPRPILFFQGEWDNQTPAYQLRGIEIQNRYVWRNSKLRFTYFPKLGHDLGPRESYVDLLYRPISEEALGAIVGGIGKLASK